MITEMNQDEMMEVDGGILPIVLAVFCTAVEFSMVAGIFDGIRDSETNK